MYLRPRDLLSLVLLWQSISVAKQPLVICGTESSNSREELFLHRRSMAARARLSVREAATTPGKDIGDIAVMYDSGGVITRRNPFNLPSQSITFTPSPGFTKYRFKTSESLYSSDAANSGSILEKLGDDDTRNVPLPFPIPFFGNHYSDIWINSDGNVSFTAGDSASATKTIGLLSGGPPRIAPFFVDLDPTFSLKGVTITSDPAAFTVTWLDVPEFGNTRSPQTVQLRLYPDGRIEFSYLTIVSREIVIGISPGRAQGATEIVSFATGSEAEFSATVAERFTNSETIDSVLLSQRFFQTHDDAYDYLAVYNTLGIAARSFAVATELTVRSTYRAGFGDTEVDIGTSYGSANRMQALLNMGPLSNYPRDPRAPVPLRSPTGDTPLTVLAHETGHLFLALASIRDEVDPDARPMLGTALAHWSFNFNSEASFLEGNRIEDKGENIIPRFLTTATVEQYSPLDQYLMGFRAPEEVPPTFLVRNSGRGNTELPRKDVSMNGTRQNIHIEDVIGGEGPRLPDHTLAQRRFRMAIILLIREGTEPNPADLEQIETLRSQFEDFYYQSTSQRAFLDTTLKRDLNLSIWPAAGLTAGSTLDAMVTVSQPPSSPLTVLLRTQNGVASLPSSVTILAGETQAVIPIRGDNPGVEEISAEPSDSAYRSDYARLQVTESLSNLRLQIISGDQQVATPGSVLPQPIVIRATDRNLIPYPGIPLRVTVSEPGTVDAATLITGPDGTARVRWTPGASADQMSIAIEGTSVSVVASALGRPAFQSTAVLNAASYVPGITPGSLAVIFGAGLTAGSTAEATRLPWPTQLAGTSVTLNGQPASLYYAAGGQINLLVPSLTASSADIVVSHSLGSSATVRVPVLPVSPGLFFNTATGEGAVRTAGTGLLTSQRPAAPGEYLEIYATGLGETRPSSVPGLRETVGTPIVTLGQTPATVVFSGLSPSFPGLYQINALIPPSAPTGLVPLRIAIDSAFSNTATVTLRALNN